MSEGGGDERANEAKPQEPAEAPKPSSAASGSDVPSLVDKLRASPITFVLVAINVAVFALAESAGGSQDGAVLLRFGSMEPNHVWGGDYWRLFTMMFLHIGPLHIAANTFFGFRLCTSMERALGSRRFLFVYLASGFAAACASAIGSWVFDDARQSAGASGALFGILGAMLAVVRYKLGSWKAFTADPWVRGTVIRVGIWIGLGLVLLNFDGGIRFDNSAHIGGLFAGALATFALVTRWRLRWPAYAILLAALFVGAAHPWGPPPEKNSTAFSFYAYAYMSGFSPTGDRTPFPKNEAKGERFAAKGCKNGLGLSCLALSEYLDKRGDTARAKELENRGCELEPETCKKMNLR